MQTRLLYFMKKILHRKAKKISMQPRYLYAMTNFLAKSTCRGQDFGLEKQNRYQCKQGKYTPLTSF